MMDVVFPSGLLGLGLVIAQRNASLEAEARDDRLARAARVNRAPSRWRVPIRRVEWRACCSTITPEGAR
jgi:hypothetical protein